MLGWLRAEQGPLTITRFRTQKAALLLARLALFPRRTHSREELADLLWPDADLEAGRNSLKQSLASLRRQLEPPGTPSGSVLIADRTTIRLNPAAFSTDVAEFELALKAAARPSESQTRLEHLRRAEALYCGELLPGFYEDWVIEERERLTARMDEVRDWLEHSSLPAESVPPVTSDLPAESLPLRLPLQFTRFFGRTEEQTELGAMLRDPDTRLVTITGPGGTGKTRFAIEVARQIAPHFGNNVEFVTLADLCDPARIVEAIADTLRLSRDSARDPWEQIVEALSGQATLLLLDNLEQMADGAGPFLLSLLTRLPRLTLLATSRQRLFVAAEQEFPLSPLPTPGGESCSPKSPEEMLTFSGVQLFADRAQAARPDFQITPRSAGAIGDICRHLEGIPLALELAAAWSQALTPTQMRERLTERFDLLVSRRKGVTERHQTLWKTMAWSYDLLPPELARFWAKLSVFRGGWTEAAAAAVCGEPCVLESLGRLRARSLVVMEAGMEAGSEAMRCRLLETLREFGWAQMGASEQEALTDCHTRYYLAMGEEAEPCLTGPDSAQWLNRLAADQENVRAALGPDRAPALRLKIAGALWRFWAIRGPLSEGRLFLESALRDALPGQDEDRLPQAKALNGLAILMRRQGDMTAARDAHQRSLALWRLIGDPRGIASSLNNLGTLATLEGEYAEAEPVLRESLGLWRSLEKPVAVAQTLNNLGFLACEQDHLPEARLACTESLALFRAQSDKHGITLSLSVLAMVCTQEGRYAEAKAHCRETLAIVEELQDSQTAVGCFQLLAAIACSDGDWERAACLLGSARKLRDQIGSYQDKRAQALSAGLLDDTRKALPNALFETCWAGGQAMTLNQAIAEALQGC